jgi:Sec-independent protein translocase protein TatA
MDILGIGPLELVFILIIALIVLGPKDMVKAGGTIGKVLRQIVTSPTWHAVTKTSNELRNLPTKLIREAGLEEDIKQISDVTKNVIPPSLNQDLSRWQEDINSWTTPPTIGNPPTDPNLPEEASAPGLETAGGEQTSQTIAGTGSDEVTQSGETNTPNNEHQESQEQAD